MNLRVNSDFPWMHQKIEKRQKQCLTFIKFWEYGELQIHQFLFSSWKILMERYKYIIYSDLEGAEDNNLGDHGFAKDTLL